MPSSCQLWRSCGLKGALLQRPNPVAAQLPLSRTSAVLLSLSDISRSSTEPHNHRAAEVGRDLWMSSGPTPLLKQGHLEKAAQDHAQMTFEYFQGWR